MTASADPQRLLDLIAAGWAAQALHAAVNLGLAENLEVGNPQALAALAGTTECDPESLRRLVRALVTLGVCEEAAPDAFRLTALGAHLRADHPRSLHAWTQWWGGHLWPLWPGLAQTVRTGRSAREHLAGTHGFEHLDGQAATAARFHRAMGELTALVADRLAETWDFSRARRVVDVGGGSGTLLAAVLKAWPDLRGVLFEQGHALDAARKLLASAGLETRCDVVMGDFFAEVPAGADVYVLKSVLHDWPDEQAVRILESCRSAMGPGARLLVIERVLPWRPRPGARQRDLARSDLTMLLAHGAGERSAVQLRGLLARAGLRSHRPRPLALTMSVLEASVR